jgi:hypothetical protein
MFISEYLTFKLIVSVNQNVMEEKLWRKSVKMNLREVWKILILTAVALSNVTSLDLHC